MKNIGDTVTYKGLVGIVDAVELREGNVVHYNILIPDVELFTGIVESDIS
jgi:hypothetical protein